MTPTPARAGTRRGQGHLVTGQVGLGGVSAALDTLRRPDDHVKVLVRPGLPGTGLHPAP
ncbi:MULTISPECIES: hypothetical protein [unclassified Streptomyces]|uniref:Uncharacterized protein n=1 Tax=Streptomyces sp. NBC_00119 TaxID=2975659 RepID=A0AAU1U3J6_9ACTN|nr:MULTISPECIES: hypothetical protein [unclassified Streptomyces]MCX4642168.1 hypothetical protein [Streptomyces sp. NBC_01446]MCX5327112.1 hypothetical protein [Streptomyces sp. NBC_00120]